MDNSRAKAPYVEWAKPVGFARTAAVCGKPGCENAGKLWLTSDEHTAYQSGQTVFEVKTRTVKIAVEPYAG